jgi:hypothetical protein
MIQPLKPCFVFKKTRFQTIFLKRTSKLNTFYDFLFKKVKILSLKPLDAFSHKDKSLINISYATRFCLPSKA